MNQRTLYSTVSFTGRIQGPRNQEIEAGDAPVTIITNDPQGTLCSVPATLCFAGLKVLM